jgi:hypothetical protein
MVIFEARGMRHGEWGRTEKIIQHPYPPDLPHLLPIPQVLNFEF